MWPFKTWKSKPIQKRRFRPQLEHLEDRLVPATLTVNTIADAVNPSGGALTLRDAIAAVNAGNTTGLTAGEIAQVSGTFGVNDTIQFSLPNNSVIGLLSALPQLTNSVVIQGPGANELAIERSALATTPFNIFTVGASATVTLSGLTASNADDTGIANNNGGTLTLIGVTVQNNNATNLLNLQPFGSAGGILNTGTLTIIQSTIANNSDTNSQTSAGIDSESGSVLIVDSTITGNFANNTGAPGGIGDFAGSLVIVSSTITGNITTDTNNGGAITIGVVGTSAEMINSIVDGNTNSTTSTESDIAGSFDPTESAYNLIGTGGSGGLTNGTNQNHVGGTVASAGLGALANNGGPTQTIALTAGSAALNAGSTVLTTLSAALAAGTANTTFSVNDPTFLGAGEVIAIDSEQMLVTGVSGTTVTVTRGYNSTTAPAHLSGAAVFLPTDQRGFPINTPAAADIGAFEVISPPTVTASTASLPENSATLTINGTGFDSNKANDSVVFNDGAAGTVTTASATQLTVTFTTNPTSTGSLTAVVTADGLSSGAAVQVAAVAATTTLSTTYETPASLNFGNLITNPVGPVTYTTTLLDPLLAVQQQYGLTTPDIAAAFNARGQDEKYLSSSNGKNAANGGYYVLMPNGGLYAWNGVSIQSTILQTPIASLSPAVYQNPLLLTSNTGAPVVSGTNPLYGLKMEFGLVTPPNTSYFNRFGANEKWLESSNGSNAANGGWYMLLPNDTLVAWNGTNHAMGSLAANLSAYGNVYANPSLLDSAQLPTSVGVSAAVNATTGLLTLTPAAGFDRSIQVTVTAKNGSQTASKTFTFTVTDTAPNVPTVAAQTVAHNAVLPTFNLGATGSAGASLAYTTSVTGDNTVYSVKLQYGLTSPDITSAYNARGGNEKYFQSTNGSNAAHGGYYVLMPTGDLYAWNGISLSTTTAQTPVANLSAYGVYANTALLYKAQLAPIPVVFSNQGTLYDVKEQFGLTAPDITAAYNARGGNEKYFQSGNGSNAANGGYYVLMPDGLLYAWDGISLAASVAQSPVANLSSEGVYANTALLYNAQPTVVNDPIYALKEQLGLYTADIAAAFNARGGSEKYFQSGNGSNPAHGGYYVLMPNNDLYAWNGVSLATTIAQTPVAQFMTAAYNSTDVYDNTTLLYSDVGQTLAATASIDSSGNVTISQNSYYIGTAGVTATVSDGAESTAQSFLFTSTNAAPTVPTISPVTVAHGAAVPTVSLGASDTNGDALTYSVSVSADNPLYDIQVEFGLTKPDITSAFNARGGQEKYFQSTNGSNAANGGYYVLMPTGDLYAWNGVSLATTTAASPAADPGTAAYANTVLLYKAQAPASPTVQVNRGPLYDIREEFGLTQPDITAAFNARGGFEKYFQSTNGSNAINGGYYVLLPNGNLYAWNGISLATTDAATPVANLSSYGVYAQPSLLYNAQPAFVNGGGVQPAVTASVDANGNITLTPNVAFAGSVRITAVVSDGLVNTTQSFTFTVTDPTPTLPSISAVNASSSAGSTSVNLNASSSDANNTLQFSATFAGYSPLDALKTSLGLTNPDITSAFNARGGNEKYFQSTNDSNAANGGYYVLMPNGNLYAWNGVSLATTTTAANLVGAPGTAAYANTALLFNATQPSAPIITTSFTNTTSGGTLQLAWPSGYTGTFMTTVFVGDGALETQQSFLVTVS